MCEICLHYPCHPQCPHAPEPHSVYICSGCGNEIYEGDDYWDIMGEQFCEQCIDDAKREAVYDPD